MSKYFAYNQEYGFETFETLVGAEKWANDILVEERGEAAEGWNEDILDNMCFGEISKMVEQVGTDKKIRFDGELVECVDYQFKAPTTPNTGKE